MMESSSAKTTSRPDIMFAVCACARFQVTPKVSHLHAVKRIFRYLKGQPKLGLWYPRDSPFDLEAFSDSDYAGASLDRKSTTGGCQFLGKRLISWQCKKQTIVANSTTEAEYVAAANCCGQVLWIQNQMLDYGFNFMNTKIYIDNESTICIVKNPVFHSKTKHIEIRHHFIRDSYEKRLIQVIKIHTDHNVADLLTKAFDVGRFQYLTATANDEIQVSIIGLPYYWQALNQVTELPQTSKPIPNVADEDAYEEWDDKVERATTTAASLDAIQASGNITKTQSTTIPNVALRGSIAQTRSERVPTHPHDSPLPRVNTLGSDEGSMQLQELMAQCTKLSDRVLALETDLRQTKKVYGATYTKLIMKVKKLEKTIKARRRAKIVLGVFSVAKVLADAAKNVHTYTRRRRAVSTGSGEVSTASRLFSTAEESLSTTGASMPVSTVGTQRQERAGYEAAVRLQEQLDEEERQRIARVHEDVSSFNIEEWEDIQAIIEADEELAQRIQAEEREKYFETVKARLLAELINQRKRYFAQQRAEEKNGKIYKLQLKLRKRYFAQQRAEERRNKPLTQAQQRTYMSNYIKHMGSHTLQQLKRLSFDELKALFETTMRRVQTFHPIESEGDKTTGSSKRVAEVELDHEGSKKQKTNEASGSVQEQPEEEETELPQEDLQQMMMVVPVEEVYVEALQVKYPIIDWEVYFEDTRRDDLVKLWDLVKERFNTTEPTDDKEKEL
ncbi:hypothetical protein Tco_0872684 [Tanacetum coccineum]